MKNDKKITATTVKLDDDLYTEFKVLAIRRRLSLQGFMEKCVHLFIENEEFRSIVDSYSTPTNLSTSGSFSITIITGSASN